MARAALAAGALLSTVAAASAQTQDTIKIGVLHSLSGTMAISETTLKDTILMMVDDLNKKGGLLGKKVEAVVVDPASNWPLFAEKARELLTKDKVAAVFGCWTSVSRKSVLPVFEELNGLLFYPVQYEGEESSNNVFYTGAAPNQQAIPAVEYLMSEEGGDVKRWVLEGTDYVYPRTTNKILEAFLKSKGVAAGGHQDQLHAVRPLRLADRGRRDQEIRLGRQEDRGGVDHQRRRQRAVLQGAGQCRHQGVATSRSSPSRSAKRSSPASTPRTWSATSPPGTTSSRSRTRPTTAFIKQWHDFIKNPKRVTNDPMEAHYIGFKMWAQAVQQAGTTDVDAVRQAMYGQKVKAPSGFVAVMNTNHHLSKPVMIGEIQAGRSVRHRLADQGRRSRPTPGARISPEDKGKVADWTYPWVCGNCTAAEIHGLSRASLAPLTRGGRGAPSHRRPRVAAKAGAAAEPAVRRPDPRAQAESARSAASMPLSRAEWHPGCAGLRSCSVRLRCLCRCWRHCRRAADEFADAGRRARRRQLRRQGEGDRRARQARRRARRAGPEGARATAGCVKAPDGRVVIADAPAAHAS